MKEKFEVEFTPRFRRRLSTLKRRVQARILRETGILRADPYIGKPLRGPWRGVYSLRIGDYRVLYQLSNNKVFLLTVGHRKLVYRR